MLLDLEPDVEHIKVNWEASLEWESNSGNVMRYEISDEKKFTYVAPGETSGKTFPNS